MLTERDLDHEPHEPENGARKADHASLENLNCHFVIQNSEIRIAWFIICTINCFSSSMSVNFVRFLM